MIDNGTRKTFETGAQKEADGKGLYELISPIAMDRLAKHLEKGANKYAARNWEKGIPLGRLIQSLLRHTFQYLGGCRDEDHLAAIMCNAMFLIHTEDQIVHNKLPQELNDLPNYKETK